MEPATNQPGQLCFTNTFFGLFWSTSWVWGAAQAPGAAFLLLVVCSELRGPSGKTCALQPAWLLRLPEGCHSTNGVMVW